MSDESLAGTIVSRKSGKNTLGIVIESDNLERAKKKESRRVKSDGKYRNMVAVQWYDKDSERLEEGISERMESDLPLTRIHNWAVSHIKSNYEEGNVGWHKKGALLVVLESPSEDE